YRYSRSADHAIHRRRVHSVVDCRDMFRWLCVALALGGCDTLFGLETIDPIAATVQGTYRHRMVRNDSSFQPVPLEEILEVGSISIEAILDDGTRSSVDYRADGSFSFPVAYEGQGYRLI